METVCGHSFSSKASKKKYKLGIISNTDDDLFAASAKHLDVAFDMVVTAQQARSYKPALNIFLLAIKQARVVENPDPSRGTKRLSRHNSSPKSWLSQRVG